MAKSKAKPTRKPTKNQVAEKLDGLTLKQRQFINAYLGEANGNATEAARIAGYAKPAEQGYENLRKPQIRSTLDARLTESAMSSQEVLSRLASMARGSVSDFLTITPNGTYCVDLDKARLAGKLHLIKTLKPTKEGLGIELHDAQAALGLLAKFHGLLLEKPPAPPASDKPDDLMIPDEDGRPEPPPES